MNLQPLLDFALDASWQAGRITLGYFQTGVAVERKSDNTPVTIADRSAEERLRSLIGTRFPDHGIIGEEYGEQPGSSGLSWIIDPIDGTKSFAAGVPLYGSLLALVEGDRVLVGVAHFPALNETVYAARGLGCFWNGRRARVSSVGSLADSVLLMSDVKGYGDKTAAWQKLIDSTYIQRTWGDSYGYLLVATGRAEIMLDPKMAVWDCAPFGVIMEEAGGTFTDWQGKATIYAGEAVATNGTLFEQVMAITSA
ncbi:MAG: inositol monophosphatase family protein [Anaerolineae bacterium]|nr:inositol monophosphatase family protein [Anaerolineae bacterium]